MATVLAGPSQVPGGIMQTPADAPVAGMQRSASQQLLIGQEPDTPSMLIPVSATAIAPSNVHAGLMLPGQAMTVEQVG